MDGNEENLEHLVEEIGSIDSPERREVLQHLLKEGRRETRRKKLKMALRQTMAKREMAWDCVAALRDAWAFLRREDGGIKDGDNDDVGDDDDDDDGGEDADLKNWMIAAEMALIGSGSGSGGDSRRIEEDYFKNLAMEAKVRIICVCLEIVAFPG